MKVTTKIGLLLLMSASIVGCADMPSGEIEEEMGDATHLQTTVSAVEGDQSMDAQSTTGPTPPSAVLERDLERRMTYSEAAGGAAGDVVIADVPSYLWRHGCGPTALGMVLGYYDAMGYDLIDGDASTQTAAVEQAIASGGDSESNPFPPGSEAHFEDYAMPLDENGLVDDAYITAGRSPHNDDCIADYMDTSRSSRSNRYGWSWSSDIVPAFLDYVAQEAPGLAATATTITSLSWEQFTTEMDNNRPMVFLVDTDGNNSTDHFVTVIGYRDTPTQQYACRDTWSDTIRWEAFAGMADGQPWGIWGGYTFELDSDGDHCNDGQTSGDETDLDCGGSCEGCPNSWNCNVNADCLSDYCLNGHCQMKPVAIPGRVEAEEYFGAGDTTMGNEGDRECDHIGNVDAELTSDVGGGCNVGWTEAGEYMDYEITVATTQDFDITARLASEYTDTSIHIEIDGVDVTGSLVAPSNGWQSFADRTAENVTVTAGQHTIRIAVETDYININYIDFTPSGTPIPTCDDGILNQGEEQIDCGGPCPPCPECELDSQCDDSNPCTNDFCIDDICTYLDNGTCGSEVVIPARVEAEDYARYYDTTAGNEGGGCDTGDDVDKENTGDSAGGGCNVGWTDAGEWLEYDITVDAANTFDITARVASNMSGKSFRIEIDGVDVTGAMSVPANGWQSYSNVTAENITISAGSHVVRLVMVTNYINVNWLDFELSATTDCGNGTCDADEDCESCPQDCGTCPDHFCNDGTCDADEDCESCPQDCGTCPTDECTCPSGCDSVVNESTDFVKNGTDNTCYFFSGSAGSYINSWNMAEVNLNGTDITNTWTGAGSYPAQSDGGYYLYVHSTVSWGHVEVTN